MSTARDRFGVSILVGLALAVALNSASVAADARSGYAARGAPATNGSDIAKVDAGFGVVGSLDNVVSNRTQLALGLGAGVPLLLFAIMVRRRMHADF